MKQHLIFIGVAVAAFALWRYLDTKQIDATTVAQKALLAQQAAALAAKNAKLKAAGF